MVMNTDGQEEVANWLGGESANPPTHIAFGDDNTTPTVGDTSLGNELLRKAATITVSGRSVEYEGAVATSELVGSTIKETGLLNSSSGGDLYSHEVNANISKTANFQLTNLVQLRVRG